MALAEFIDTRLLRPAPVRRAANAILLSIVPKTVRVGPAIAHLNPRDPVVSGALALRVFERDELRFFSQRCRPGMTVLDVGANVGLYTALAMHLTGADGTVVVIEPHAESRRFLELTVQANSTTRTSVHIFDCAVSDGRERPSCSSIRKIKPTIDWVDPRQRRTRKPAAYDCEQSTAT